MKKEISIGNIKIGGSNHIAIQSMCNIKTSNIDKVIKQINELESVGCELIRVSILDLDDANAISIIKKNINIPLIADIHFDYKLAIEAIKNGADKIRINPGNIGSIDRVKEIIKYAKEYNIPIRIGVNSGSLEKDLKDKYGTNSKCMLESMKRWIKVFEDENFTNLVLSIKATSITDFIDSNIELDKISNYPIHIGLTESGTPYTGVIRSSYAVGTLLNKNIGSTVRISLNGDPLREIKAAKEILAMFNLYTKPLLICCPTCGRTMYNMESIVNDIEKYLNTLNVKLKVAIMGCVVNGPGEASDADIGIAGGINEALLFKKGKPIRKIKQDNVVEELINEINEMIEK